MKNGHTDWEKNDPNHTQTQINQFWVWAKKKRDSRINVRWSAVLGPCLGRLWLKLKGELSSGPMFQHMGDFLLLLLLLLRPPPPSWLRSLPQGQNLSPDAQIPALRSKSQPWGPNPSLGVTEIRLEPHGWDLGLKTGIWAKKLGFGPHGWDLALETWIWVRGGDLREGA